jgi:hypothetical protein
LYDMSRAIELDDRALAHMQVVVIDKLRRGERFALSLVDNRGSMLMWVTPFSALQFVYAGNRQPPLNRAWLEELSSNASLTGILSLTPEPRNLMTEPPGLEPM